MTDINSAFYLYDSNGKTIGYKTADSNLKDYDATAGERENPSGHVGGDTRETYYYNGEWWTICDASALELCSTEEELYKKLSEILDNGVTVEQLSVDQITSLFINGDLTVGELKKGLFSKEGFSSKDWDLQQNDDWTIAKFTINGKKYSIKCVTEQCNAQTDLWHTDADIKHALAQGQYGYLQRYEGRKNLDEETQYAIQRAKQKQTEAFHEQNRQKIYDNMSPETRRHTDMINEERQRTAQTGQTAGAVSAPADLAKEDGGDVGKTWTEKDLQLLGLDIDCYLDKYFTKNSDGTYSMKCPAQLNGKQGVYVENAFVNDIETLKDRLGVLSLDDFYNQLEISAGGNGAYDIVNIWRLLADQKGGYYEYLDYLENNSEFNQAAQQKYNKQGSELTNAEAMSVLKDISDQTVVNIHMNVVLGLLKEHNLSHAAISDDAPSSAFAAQDSYSPQEIHKLFTEEEIQKYFYLEMDTSGRPTGAYKLKNNEDGQELAERGVRTTLSDLDCIEQGKPIFGVTQSEAIHEGYTIVSTAAELKAALASNPNATIVLSGDIDMSGVDWTPVGTVDNPFKGTIYGNGYAIKNLKIESKDQYAGMFGVFEGNAYDIKMENCSVKDVRGDDVAGIGGTGIFAGMITGRCVNIEVINGKVNGRDNAGLLAGIIKCSDELDEVRYCRTSGNVYGAYAAGGIAGMFDGSGGAMMRDCKSTADVNGQVWAGGIVGQAEHIFGYDVWVEEVALAERKKITSLIKDCNYEGSINKDINNPPGAMGAGSMVGRMSIDDKARETLDKILNEPHINNVEDPDEYRRALVSNLGIDDWFDTYYSGNYTIHNTYASGIKLGWICTLNDDGTVKETQDYIYNIEKLTANQGSEADIEYRAKHPKTYFFGKYADVNPPVAGEVEEAERMQEKEIETQIRQDYDRMILLWARNVKDFVRTEPVVKNEEIPVAAAKAPLAKPEEYPAAEAEQPLVADEEVTPVVTVEEPPVEDEEVSPVVTAEEPVVGDEEVPPVVTVEEPLDEDGETHLDVLSKLGVSVIKKNDDGSYSGYYNNNTYNCLWDPIEHKWLTYDPDDLAGAGVRNRALARVAKILAALAMGLKFTSDINTCKDSQGNIYKYDEESGTYVMQK